MAAVSPWPLDAELLVEISDFPGDPRIRSSMRAGPPKIHRLGTAAVGTVRGAIQITADDVESLVRWGEDTLSSWTQPFLWTHPRTGRTRTFIFTAVPEAGRRTVEEDGESLYLVPLALEVLP